MLVERQYPFLSEHDYGIKGLPGLVFSFSESNPAHLCNLWNRVQTVIRDAKSITSHHVLELSILGKNREWTRMDANKV